MKTLYRTTAFLVALVFFSGAMPEGIAAQEGYAPGILEPDIYSNATRNYYEGSGGFSSNGKFISVKEFTMMDIWKNEWPDIADWEGGAEENILSFDGMEYKLRLADPKDNTILSGFATPASSADEFVTINIPEGNYAGISLLGGADSSASSAKAVLRFNYTDGTDSGWIEYDQLKVSAEDENALAVPAKKYSSGTVIDADYLYLHRTDVLADQSKTMRSVDFLVRNALLKSDGTVEIGPTSGASGYRYYSRYAAITMLCDRVQAEMEKLRKIESIMSMLPDPDNFEFSDENIERLYTIKQERETIDESIITEQEEIDILELADKYIALLVQIDIAENNKIIEEIGEKLRELPTVENISLSEDILVKLDKINELYNEVDMTLAIEEKYRQILDSVVEYNSRIYKLKRENNDQKACELEKIENTLPELEEFENAQTYTDEVMAKLKELKNILDSIDEETGVSEQYKDIIDTAREYAGKIDYINILENDEIAAEIVLYMDELPPVDNFEYTRENEAKIEKISELCERFKIEFLTQEHTAVLEKAKEYIVLLTNFPPVSQMIEPERFANYERTFYKSPSAAYDNYGVDWEKYMAMDFWEKPWNISSNVGENTLTFNDITYKLRLVTENKGIKSIYNSNAGTSVGYEVLDVADGKYIGVSFLGGAAHAGGSAGAAFNYDDGTSSPFITKAVAKMNVPGADALKIPAYKYDSDAAVSEDNLYLYQYNFDNPYPEKTVVSISIPFRNVIINDGDISIQPTSGSNAYRYWVRWFGITMLQSTKAYKEIISEKFKELENEKEITAKVLEPIDELVKNAAALGIDVTDIDGYDIYEKKGAYIVRIMGYEAEADLKLASVKAVFAGDVVITEDDIELYGPDGNKMEFNFEYANRTAEITFKNTFDYDSEYILKLSKNISAGGNYMGYDEEYSFKIPQVLAFSEFTVNEAEDIVKISFVLNNYAIETTDVMVSICVIDADGKLTDSAIVRSWELENGAGLTASDISLKISDEYKLKVFVLDNIENMNTIYKYEY